MKASHSCFSTKFKRLTLKYGIWIRSGFYLWKFLTNYSLVINLLLGQGHISRWLHEAKKNTFLWLHEVNSPQKRKLFKNRAIYKITDTKTYTWYKILNIKAIHSMTILLLLKCILIFLTFTFERERECEWGRGRERGRKKLKQAPGSKLSAQSPTWGLNSWTTRS